MIARPCSLRKPSHILNRMLIFTPISFQAGRPETSYDTNTGFYEVLWTKSLWYHLSYVCVVM